VKGPEVFLDVHDLVCGIETNHVDRRRNANGMEYPEGVDPKTAAWTQVWAESETAPSIDKSVSYVSP
jgi:hypothetical protein